MRVGNPSRPEVEIQFSRTPSQSFDDPHKDLHKEREALGEEFDDDESYHPEVTVRWVSAFDLTQC